MEVNLTELTPKAAELHELVAKTKHITATDLKDKAQLAVVKASRIELRNARITIEKLAKKMREDAQSVVKQVLAAEKEHIAIIAPEEDRLAAIEEQAKVMLVIEERERKLPERRARLEAIDPDEVKDHDGTISLDAFLCNLDDVDFEAFYNERVRINNEAAAAKKREEQEAKQRELDERQAVLDKAEREAEMKKEVAAAEERGRAEAEQKAKDAAALQARLAEAKAKQDEADALAAREKLEKSKRFQAFLTKNAVPTDTEMLTTSDIYGGLLLLDCSTEYALFKKLDSFKK